MLLVLSDPLPPLNYTDDGLLRVAPADLFWGLVEISIEESPFLPKNGNLCAEKVIFD